MTQQHHHTSKPRRYLGMTGIQCSILVMMSLALCFCIGISSAIVLTNFIPQSDTLTSSSRTKIPKSNAEIVLDIPALYGNSLDEIRSKFNIATYEELRPLLHYEDVVPNGRFAEGYTHDQYTFTVFYDESLKAIGFQLYMGFESHHLKLEDWKTITQMFNLNITQSPEYFENYRVEWNNLTDYHIELVRELGGEYVIVVIIVEAR